MTCHVSMPAVLKQRVSFRNFGTGHNDEARQMALILALRLVQFQYGYSKQVYTCSRNFITPSIEFFKPGGPTQAS